MGSLLSIYSSRIMIGMDLKYWQSQNGTVADPAATLALITPFYETLLSQLPEAAEADIRQGTAIEVLGL